MILKLNLSKSFSHLTKQIKRVLICSDKFKFSLTSPQVSQIIKSNLPSHIQHKTIFLADGGEGSLDAIATKLRGNWINSIVSDPLFRPIQSKYFQISQNQSFIQMALASGLPLLTSTERNPLKTTTYGTGELILHSLQRGNKKLHLLIGGSATNDGGIGCASALGFKFYNKSQEQLSPIGQNLIKICSIKHEDKVKKQLLSKAKISVYTDVTNPLTGINGASFVYSPQKGGSPQTAQLLDRGLDNLNSIFKKQFNIDANSIPGSGAAGGLGAGCAVLLGSQLRKGIDLIFSITQFEQHLKWADLVITGEGKFDSQTMKGKAVKGVIDRCLQNNKPVIVLCAVAQQRESYSITNDVQVIEVLTGEQQKTIDPEVTKRKLKLAIRDIFKNQF